MLQQYFYRLVFFAVMALSAAGADASPQRTFFVAGQRLVTIADRRDIGIVNGLDLEGSLEKSAKVLHSDYPVAAIICDRIVQDLCMIGRNADLTSQVTWSSVNLATGKPVVGWDTIASARARLEAIDAEDGLALWSVEANAAGNTGELPPGVYLSKRNVAPVLADRIMSTSGNGDHPSAEFVGAKSHRQILVRSDLWALYDLSGKMLASHPDMGLSYLGSDERGMYLLLSVVGEAVDKSVIPVGSLGYLTFAEAEKNQWTVFIPYFAGKDSRPPLVGEALAYGMDASNISSFAFVAGRALVWASAPYGAQLGEICYAGDTLKFKDLKQSSYSTVGNKIARVGETGGIAYVSRRDGLGVALLVGFSAPAKPSLQNTSLAQCDDTLPRLQTVRNSMWGGADALPADVTVTHGEAIAPDGKHIPYRIFTNPAGGNRIPSRILIRAYGAFGVNPIIHLNSDLERQLVRSDTAIIVPILRGDGGLGPEWVKQGYGDYKQRTSSDLIAVAQSVLEKKLSTTSRIDLLGISAGAFPCAKAAFQRPDLFDSVILVSGSLDLKDLASRSPNVEKELGPPTGDFPDWFGGKPAGKENPPRFFLAHAEDDDIVNVANSEHFWTYAKSLGYRARLGSSKIGGHGVDLLNIEEFMSSIIDFFNHK